MAGDLQAVIDAVASPVRREILWLTWDEERSVGDLGAHFDISGPTLSSHLASLRDAGLVTMRVDGNFRRYRCNHEAVRRLVPLLASDDERWIAADDVPERDRATATDVAAVRVEVTVPIPPEDAFADFADGERYSRWLGVPVRIRERRFAATLEWGTHVRGSYEVLSPPDLIAMRWDFDDDTIPLPGRGLVAYLRIRGARGGCRVEVHQLADDRAQVEFLSAAWSMVLGRFATYHADGQQAAMPRAARPKRNGAS